MDNIIETIGEKASAGMCVLHIREIWVARKLEDKGQVQLFLVQVQCFEPSTCGWSLLCIMRVNMPGWMRDYHNMSLILFREERSFYYVNTTRQFYFSASSRKKKSKQKYKRLQCWG